MGSMNGGKRAKEEKPTLEYFGRWLDRHMTLRGMSSTSLGEMLQIHNSTVNRWKNGNARPSMEAVAGLAGIFKVDPIRLGVTATAIRGKMAEGISVLPIPAPPPEDVGAVLDQIKRIKGTTQESRDALAQFYLERRARLAGET